MNGKSEYWSNSVDTKIADSDAGRTREEYRILGKRIEPYRPLYKFP